MKQKKIPYMTIILVAINIIVFLCMEFTVGTNDTLALFQWGGMHVPSVVYDGEWYRVFSHMFLHSGFEHLLSNMFMLAVMGSEVEALMGKWKYILLYFISGFGGTIISAIPEILSQNFVVGVGASGAITGLVAAYIIVIIKNRNKISVQYIVRLLIVLALIVLGDMEEGVDWMAHLGGALTGLLMGMLLYRRKKKEKIYE